MGTPNSSLKFKSGPPPHIGWWRCKDELTLAHLPEEWRWWNGLNWSQVCIPIQSAISAADDALYKATQKEIQWSTYYPANPRVARIKP